MNWDENLKWQVEIAERCSRINSMFPPGYIEKMSRIAALHDKTGIARNTFWVDLLSPLKTPDSGAPEESSEPKKDFKRMTVEEFFKDLPIEPEDILDLFDRNNKTHPPALEIAVLAWSEVRKMESFKHSPKQSIIEFLETYNDSPLDIGKRASEFISKTANFGRNGGAPKT
ncbi:MAG: hypothetical protein LBM75_03025 [Myxococcales bacterium]|jgi:hypothetical protein|nr:hypothetical protein [Myxococcales bacterium]